jgi:hypothetical protein
VILLNLELPPQGIYYQERKREREKERKRESEKERKREREKERKREREKKIKKHRQDWAQQLVYYKNTTKSLSPLIMIFIPNLFPSFLVFLVFPSFFPNLE